MDISFQDVSLLLLLILSPVTIVEKLKMDTNKKSLEKKSQIIYHIVAVDMSNTVTFQEMQMKPV